MNRIDADTPPLTRVLSLISGEAGTLLGICPDGRADVNFDTDPPGYTDSVDPTTLAGDES